MLLKIEDGIARRTVAAVVELKNSLILVCCKWNKGIDARKSMIGRIMKIKVIQFTSETCAL